MFLTATTWNEHGRHYWADLDKGPRHGPFTSFHAARDAARIALDFPALDIFASCPERFCIPDNPIMDIPPINPETCGDNRGEA